MNPIQGNGARLRTVEEICQGIELRGDARRLLHDDLTPPEFFDLLVEKQQYNDAIRFLAHALPKRLAIWWGCLCLWQQSRPGPEAKTAAVLAAACRWVFEPTEANRRAAEAPGRSAGLDSAAGCLGMAIFWSGGSMGRADLPLVPPPATLAHQALAGAVLLAAATSGPAKVRGLRRREFLALGRDVAAGRALWFEGEPPILANGHIVQERNSLVGSPATEDRQYGTRRAKAGVSP
jgi:hypothetical protein